MRFLVALLMALVFASSASAQLTGSVIVTDPGGSDAPGDSGPLGYICNGPVDLDLLKITITDNDGSNSNAFTVATGCTGTIDRLEVETNSVDGVKIQNSSVTPAHDLVINDGYIRSTGCIPGGHCDGVQGMGGDRITFNSVLIAYAGRTGGGGFYPSLGGSLTGGEPTDIVCNGCHIQHGATSVRVDASIRSGVRNSVVCAPVGAAEHAHLVYAHGDTQLVDPVGVSRYPVTIRFGENEDALTEGNVLAAANDPRCTTEPGSVTPPPPPPPPACDSLCVAAYEARIGALEAERDALAASLAACRNKLIRIHNVRHSTRLSANEKLNRIDTIYHEAGLCQF